MNMTNLLASPSIHPFCGTCMHWVGVREFRDGYCITPLSADGFCRHAADVPDALARPPIVKQAREKGCEIWRALGHGE